MAEGTTYAELRLSVLPLRDEAKSRDRPQKPVWHQLFCSPLPASVQRGIVLFLVIAIGLGICSCCLLATYGLKIRGMEGGLEDLQQQLQDSHRALERTNEALKDWEKLMSGDLQFCMAGWQWKDGKCYYFSTFKKSWERSKEDCQSREATLAMIRDNQTMDFIRQYSNGSQYLIGLKKDNSRNVWKWQDGTVHEKYYPVKRTERQTYSCATVSSGELYEESCSNVNQWICEKGSYTFQVVRVRPPPAVLHFGGVRYTDRSLQ